jgi:hypothetical protein
MKDELPSANPADIFGEDTNVVLRQQDARRLDVRGANVVHTVLERVQNVGSTEKLCP